MSMSISSSPLSLLFYSSWASSFIQLRSFIFLDFSKTIVACLDFTLFFKSDKIVGMTFEFLVFHFCCQDKNYFLPLIIAFLDLNYSISQFASFSATFKMLLLIFPYQAFSRSLYFLVSFKNSFSSGNLSILILLAKSHLR